MEKIRIRDKHPGSATLLICFTLSNVQTYNSGSVILEFIDPDPGGHIITDPPDPETQHSL
jgi:hypothetical protein